MSSGTIDLFPFPGLRHGQRDFLQDARDCLVSGNVLVAHAPTGLGKTAVALAATLEAAIGRNGRTVFLTPRQSQHRVVIETVKVLPAAIKTVDLLSRESMCPLGPQPPCLNGKRCHLQAERRIVLCAKEVLRRPMHAQESMSLCVRRGACPYLTARLALNGADLVVGDYSRVFGDLPDILRFQGSSRPQYLVVDEAHNLPSRVREMFSKEHIVPSSDDDELERVWREMLSQGHRKITFGELRTHLESLGLPGPEILEERDEFVRDWYRFGEASMRIAHPDESRISLRFLEPSLVVQNVLHHCTSAIFMSGTLHPPEVFAALLGIEDCLCRTYPSPFDPRRRLAIIVPEVGTRFRERCRESTKDMSQRVAQLSRDVPGNVLVFLPSYSYLSAVHRELRNTRLDKVLLAERPGLGKEEKDGLARRLLDGPNVLLLCNIHGSFSEGVDFPAGCISAVMVAGLPIPPPGLERKELMLRTAKRIGEEKARLYLDTYEALSKVLQACGRAIRREEDRAAIVLLDPRYLDQRVVRLLPPDMKFVDGDPSVNLRAFFHHGTKGHWLSSTEGERIITEH